MQLLLIELALRLLDVSVEELLIISLQEVPFSRPLIVLLVHEFDALLIEGDQGKGSTALPILIEIFKFKSKTIFLREELRVGSKKDLTHYDVEAVVTFLIGVHTIAKNGVLFLGLIGL